MSEAAKEEEETRGVEKKAVRPEEEETQGVEKKAVKPKKKIVITKPGKEKEEKFELPTLYKEDANGRVRQWEVYAIGNKIYTKYGIQGMKLRTTPGKEAKGKNTGRSNATTA